MNATDRNQHRFRVRPYGARWITYDNRTHRILEFSDGKGTAVQLAAGLNAQLGADPGWDRLATAVKGEVA